MDITTLVQLRREAESAVADMSDGTLKLKAFEVILDNLISGRSHAISRKPPALGRREQGGIPSVKQERRGPRADSKAARILLLKNGGFFTEERSISAVRNALRDHGWIYPLTSLSGALQGLVQKGQLRRARVSDGKKKTYKYVNP